MKLFKVLLSIIGFFVLVFVVSLFFPREYHIKCDIVINKPPYESFAYMNNIRNWEDWSPWNTKLDSTMKTFYSKNTIGTGATFYFRGGLTGSGSIRISESVLNERIKTFVSINEGAITSKACFQFGKVADKTILSWIDDGDVGYNPIYRFMIPSKVKDTELAFNEGLILIKHAIEARP